MDNDWDQYVGDLDLEYNNEKFEVADECPSLSAIQVPTPPVSTA